MTFQFTCCTVTLLTYIAKIWLYTFMSTYVFLKLTFEAVLLLTNVTREPSSFTVRLQQMWLKWISTSETFWTMSTRVWLCTSVNTGMPLHILSSFEQFSTVRTVILSSIVMHKSFMCMQPLKRRKRLLHRSHSYGFCPLWIPLCLVRFPEQIVNNVTWCWNTFPSLKWIRVIVPELGRLQFSNFYNFWGKVGHVSNLYV